MPTRDGSGLRVVVDASRNALRLLIPGAGHAGGTTGDPPTVVAHEAVLDVGEAGRLLGLEIAPGAINEADDYGAGEPWYLELEDAPGRQLRSVPVTVDVARAPSGEPLWVDLPRRGDGYELTFPIGNQCWVRPRRRTE